MRQSRSTFRAIQTLIGCLEMKYFESLPATLVSSYCTRKTLLGSWCSSVKFIPQIFVEGKIIQS